jgi:phage terminase small subunit
MTRLPFAARKENGMARQAELEFVEDLLSEYGLDPNQRISTLIERLEDDEDDDTEEDDGG